MFRVSLYIFSLVGYGTTRELREISDGDILKIEQSAVEIVSKIKKFVTENIKKAKARRWAIEHLFRLIFGDVFAVLMASDPNIVFKFSLGEIALIQEVSEIVRERIADKEYLTLASSCQVDTNMMFYASTKQTIIGTLFDGSCSCDLIDEMEKLGKFIK